MKRFGAYCVDFIVLALGLSLCRDSLFRAIPSYNLLWFIYFIIIYLFFGMNDIVFRGSSIGKKLFGMNIVLKKPPLLQIAILHSLLKIIFSFMWPISILLLITGKGTMPYDKYFYESIE